MYTQKPDPSIPSVEWVRALINDQINKNAATGAGDVTGAASSTDKAIVRWNGATGKIIQDSVITITDAGLIRLVNGTVAGVSLGNSATNGLIFGVNTVSVVTAGVERWIVNASGALNPILDNSYDIGNLSVNPRDIHISRNLVFKVTGGGSNNLSFIAPAAANTLQYILPATDPTVGQVLSASAPAAGIVTMSWATPSGGWGLAGNALTGSATAPVEYIGSTNAFDFVIKTTNVESVRVTAGGFVGINKAVPAYQLDIKANANGVSPLRIGTNTWSTALDVTAGGDFNNVTDPLVIANITTYTTFTLWCFPNQYFQIENEIIMCSDRTGTQATFIRAREGTTAAAHANGVDIFSINPYALTLSPKGILNMGGQDGDIYAYFNLHIKDNANGFINLYNDTYPTTGLTQAAGQNRLMAFWHESGAISIWPYSAAGVREDPTHQFQVGDNPNGLLEGFRLIGANQHITFDTASGDAARILAAGTSVKVHGAGAQNDLTGTTDDGLKIAPDGGGNPAVTLSLRVVNGDGFWRNMISMAHVGAGVEAPVDILPEGVGNIRINAATIGATGQGVIGIKNGTSPTAATVGTIQLFAKDTAGGNSTIAFFNEEPAIVDVGLASTHSMAIWVNIAGTLTQAKMMLA